MVFIMHQLRNYVTVFLGGVETNKLDLAEAALVKAQDMLYELQYREVLKMH